MKKTLLFLTICFLFAGPVFSQTTFSDETKKYIEYNNPVTVLKNGWTL